MEIRSYRRVFDLERRVYSVDRLRLNPSGVPVRGVMYFVAVVLAALVCSRLPLLGAGLRLAPWYLRDLLMPALAATLMALIRVEGRTFHHAARSLLRFACSRRRLVGGWRGCGCRRWYPHELLVLPDGSEARFRRLLYTGPGAVLVAVSHERRACPRRRNPRGLLPSGRRTALTVCRRRGDDASAGPRVILLAGGARLRVHRERGWSA